MSLTKVSYSMITGSPVNVRDFGAVGNGTTDDTAAINAAIAFAGPTGKSVYLPAGKYLITSTIAIDWAITLFGDIATIYTQSSYPYGTVIVKGAAVAGPALKFNTDKCAIKSLGVVGLAGNTGDGIHLNANGCLLENVQVKYVANDGVRIGGYAAGINANSCILNNVIVNYNGGSGLYIHSNNVGLPDANACAITSLSANFNTVNGVLLGNCYQNTFIGIHIENNTAWGIKLDPESRNNYFIGGDNTETNGSGQLWNRGTANMFFLDSSPTYTEAGTYTTAITPAKSFLSGEIRQTPYPSSQQGGANYFSTQVLVDGFYGGASGTGAVTNGTTYRLFTCSMPVDGNFLLGTLYISYHPALGATTSPRTFKAYAISATTNATGLAASKVTEIASYSDVDSALTTNVAAVAWSAGVLTVSNTNTRPDAAGQLFSWSFIGYQRGASNFASITDV